MKSLILPLFAVALMAVTAPAQDAVFASEDNKTLTRIAGADGLASVEMIVRSPESGVSYYSGEIPEGKAVVRFESTAYIETGEEVAIPITLRFEGDSVTVIAEFPEARAASSDPSGTYTLLTEEGYLAFAKEGFGVADAALNVRRDDLKKIIPADLLADLGERHKAWIEYREYMAQHGAGDDFEASPQYWASAWDMTQERILFLDILLGTDVDPGIPGVYLDEYGGAINILPAGADGQFRFQINVVRGLTYHTGEITKSVAISEGKARFVDTDKEAFSEDKPCTIDFEFTGNRLVLKSENSSYYHGARAYFDGTYFKTAGEPEIVEGEGE